MENSTAYQMGQFMGVIMILAIMIGTLVFFIIALIKAINTRRTGWIVAASISGLPVVLFMVLVMAGFVIGFTKGVSHSKKNVAVDRVNADVAPVAAAAANLSPPAAPQAVGVLIPAMNRVDMVHDPKRNLLYISAGDSVLRYQIDSKTFLAPLKLGGDLRGIDISPDNNLLAVADAAGGNGRVTLHVVDLQTGTDSPFNFSAQMQESGTYSVAFGADGGVWVTSSMSGSGFLYIRKFTPSVRHYFTAEQVSQDTMLAASRNREYIAFAQANNSAGDYGRFACRATHLPRPSQVNAFVYEIAINRDGTQLAVPNYQNVVLSGSSVPKLDEKQVIAAAYHPLRDYLFVTQAGTSLLSVYDTATMSKVKELDLGDAFDWTGNHAYQSGRLKLSQDGKYIFCTVTGGIRFAETGL